MGNNIPSFPRVVAALATVEDAKQGPAADDFDR